MVPREQKVTSGGDEELPRIQGYRIDGVLGRGATGVVYRATQLAVDRPVALKILHPELVGTKRAVRRLQREARTAARLAHPSIISAIDMGEMGGQWWYAMELVEGTSLAERIAAKGPLSEREAIRLFIPLCDALQHAYEGGVVHRDVKPANILIDGRGLARLVDLGLAFQEDDPMLTSTGGTLGTPHYISPEQARDPTSVDARSDIWSLGATMFHALCGSPPFDGESIAEILSAVLYHRVPDPRSLAPHLSKGMALVLRKCLVRDVSGRYQQPAELMRDLERIRERRNVRVDARSLDPVEGDRRELFVRLGLGTLAIGGAVALGLLIARPWQSDAETDGTGVVRGTWRGLERIRSNFEGGFINHAGALDELARLAGVDPSIPPTEIDDLRTYVQEDLEGVLERIESNVAELFDGKLALHAFPEAEDLIEQNFRTRLQSETGFEKIDDLPVRSTGLSQWHGELGPRLARARLEARGAAEVALRSYYDTVISVEAREHLASGRWRDAQELLDGDRLEWLADSGADVRGFSKDERSEMVLTLAEDVRTERAGVGRDWTAVENELVGFVEDEEERLLDRLEGRELERAAATLEQSLTLEAERLGVDAGQIPEGWDQRLATVREAALASLEELESELLEEDARTAFARDDADSRELASRRDYRGASAIWTRGLEKEPWREPLFPDMRLRLAEMELLESLMESALDGIRGSEGQVDFAPTGKAYVGKIERAIEGGFHLRTAGQTFPFYLRDPGGERGGHVLHPKDVVRFAFGLSGVSLSPEESLQKALFLYYEGDVEAAYQALPPGGTPAGPLLPDVKRRILSARTEADARTLSSKAELDERLGYVMRRIQRRDRGATNDQLLEDVQELLAEFDEVMTDRQREVLLEFEALLKAPPKAPTFEEAFAPDELERGVTENRLVWRFEAGLGKWEGKRGWQALGALEMGKPLTDQEQFLDVDNAARLALRPPFDATGKPFEVVFDITPQAGFGELNDLLITVAGFQFVFLDEVDGTRLHIAVGDARTALEKARKGEAEIVKGPLVFEDGRTSRLRLRVNAGTGRIEAIEFDDVTLVKGQLMTAPDVDFPAIVLRTLQPVRFERIELIGREARPR